MRLNVSRYANRAESRLSSATGHWRELDATSIVFSSGVRLDRDDLMLLYFFVSGTKTIYLLDLHDLIQECFARSLVKFQSL